MQYNLDTIQEILYEIFLAKVIGEKNSFNLIT